MKAKKQGRFNWSFYVLGMWILMNSKGVRQNHAERGFWFN
jgi:hypothetical protein